MHNTVKVRLAAAAISVGAATGLLAGGGTATAGSAYNGNVGVGIYAGGYDANGNKLFKIGPFANSGACQANFYNPWVPRSGCYYASTPHSGYYFLGRPGA